jgi:hypothetical protein
VTEVLHKLATRLLVVVRHQLVPRPLLAEVVAWQMLWRLPCKRGRRKSAGVVSNLVSVLFGNESNLK